MKPDQTMTENSKGSRFPLVATIFIGLGVGLAMTASDEVASVRQLQFIGAAVLSVIGVILMYRADAKRGQD